MRLYMELVAELGSKKSRGDIHMTDWADATAAKLRKRQDAENIKDAKFVEQQRIKNAGGIPLWHQVREEVKKHCEGPEY